MGLEFIGSIAGGLLLGWIVDQLVGSFPTGSVVGAVVGLIVGVYNYFREAVQASKEARKDDAEQRSSAP
ncbi:MAG: AtpZ/AtpI family protein [Planctomycetota bacterium]|nr:MAG: AtpZ/AtpI family protein [Planctomycetota bacterium]